MRKMFFIVEIESDARMPGLDLRHMQVSVGAYKGSTARRFGLEWFRAKCPRSVALGSLRQGELALAREFLDLRSL
jgi:hypothetical protein